MKIKTTISILSLTGLLGFGLPVYGMDLTQVTSNANQDMLPQIQNNFIVWQGSATDTTGYAGVKNWEIFLYDISNGTTTRVSDDPSEDTAPQTDGSYVTWFHGNTEGTIYYHNISTGIGSAIPDFVTGYVKSTPQIANGNIVWSASAVLSTVQKEEIYLFNISSGVTTNISALSDPANSMEDVGPMINDTMVGWIQVDDLDTADSEDDVETLMLYDIGTGTVAAAADDFVWTDSPQSDGDLTVLAAHDGNDREILVQRQLVSLQITDNSVEDTSPTISGLNVAWVSGASDAAEIYTTTLDDGDGDGVADTFDNCVATANSDQADDDNDGVGNVCDNCADVANSDQTDSDSDGTGDACSAIEPDQDNDGIDNDVDNCPGAANPLQYDLDGDGLGLMCDPLGPDTDSDGIEDGLDNCPNDANPRQTDLDGDGVGLVCDTADDQDADGITDGIDNCPVDANPKQYDLDGDGIGLVCDTANDQDTDGVTDDVDNCPVDPNPRQYDIDKDGIGAVCDSDIDATQNVIDQNLAAEASAMSARARSLRAEASAMAARSRNLRAEANKMSARQRYIKAELAAMANL